ncbi:unnamed protein product [Pseudo-nitzschia multistriata]|uniref:Calmodulin-lysine N-methyltransferase n=1 Tax=Pseudo-nitzschia multistriata TaxID=183589 RepID=A0A448ZNS7_9STRA|nr:unnamed protein product [Pseudo-nitzschia multistriata]
MEVVDSDRSKTTVISVRIPDGAEHGDSLTFEANGQNFTIEIPPGSVAGEILQIKLGKGADEEDAEMEGAGVEKKPSDDGENITIEMVTGNKISVLQSADCNASDRTLSDGTYQLIWPASRFVVKYISTPEFRSQIQNSQIHSVIELGAGHGIFGFAFADIISNFSSTKKGIKLLLTDVEEALPQLEANVRFNRQVYQERVEISTLPLKWHIQPISGTNSNIDFILGSDLLYNCSVIPSLVATIRRLLCKSTRILISVRWRKPSEERVFFTMLSDIIEWKLVHGSCTLGYQIYGDGSYESDKYFSQTMVGIKGNIVPLSYIDSTTTEQMSAEEFEQFEELQTQVYLGEAIESSRDLDHRQKRQKVEA